MVFNFLIFFNHFSKQKKIVGNFKGTYNWYTFIIQMKYDIFLQLDNNPFTRTPCLCAVMFAQLPGADTRSLIPAQVAFNIGFGTIYTYIFSVRAYSLFEII